MGDKADALHFEGYEYTAPDGTKYEGVPAFILNHIDSAEAALEAELEEKMDPDERRKKGFAWSVLRDVLDCHQTLAPYLA